MKKYLCMFISVLWMFGLLAGCGNAPDAETMAPETIAPETSASEQTTVPNETEAEGTSSTKTRSLPPMSMGPMPSRLADTIPLFPRSGMKTSISRIT